MIERRRAERPNTYMEAQLACGEGPPIIGCIVRNLSRTGAGLEVDQSVRISSLFNLVFEADASMKACRIVWRAEQRMGVEFI
jgi:hypothetical protein